ncbi:type II secretion system protein N [Massilia consociata]|uniref:Type II secretion system protein N n=1 Tax=Massilia consociata TaxID=760117 RepID=A0ABV6FBX3_9BURK
MNKRLPLLFTVLALVLLAASCAYWFLQLYKPEQRPLAPAPVIAQAEPSPDAAATLFGGQPTAMTISNYQLTGVVSAGRDSAVILVADGAPPKAVRIGREIVPGVTVAEVHPRYVMLSEGGIMKRVDLAPDTGSSQGGAMPPPPGPQPMAAEPPPGVEPQTAPGVVGVPPHMQSVPPPGGGPQGTPTTPENAQVVPEPAMDPGVANQEVPPQQPQQPPPPNQVQMPPATRSVNSPVGQPAQLQ